MRGVATCRRSPTRPATPLRCSPPRNHTPCPRSGGRAHVTFGQYPHCRIAATGPITPFYFIEFVVRSFYRTKTLLPTEKLPTRRLTPDSTITINERALVHFGVPTATS
ncbi:DUF2290 domain-containing protein [Pimelobacter simplex]|uniref:DUF2290 domain-containing protein n=1 Tax=Nocardioides simplex TaxID=2045 RepID=UPI0035B0759D